MLNTSHRPLSGILISLSSTFIYMIYISQHLIWLKASLCHFCWMCCVYKQWMQHFRHLSTLRTWPPLQKNKKALQTLISFFLWKTNKSYQSLPHGCHMQLIWSYDPPVAPNAYMLANISVSHYQCYKANAFPLSNHNKPPRSISDFDTDLLIKTCLHFTFLAVSMELQTGCLEAEWPGRTITDMFVSTRLMFTTLELTHPPTPTTSVFISASCGSSLRRFCHIRLVKAHKRTSLPHRHVCAETTPCASSRCSAIGRLWFAEGAATSFTTYSLRKKSKKAKKYFIDLK